MKGVMEITVQEFKTYFDRAFNYAPIEDPDNKEYIRDKDIENAFAQANLNFNESLWDNDDNKKLAYMFLTAHYLCMDMQMSEAGINSQGQFQMNSKSVGNVSASYTIPEMYQNDPILNYFSQTQFGCKYLSMLIPRAVGRIAVVRGTTTDV